MTSRTTLVLLGLAFSLGLGGAEPQEFTGVWKLNMQRSTMKDGGPLTLNKSHVISIVLKGSVFQWSEQRISSDGTFFSSFAEVDPSGNEAKLIDFRNGRVNDDGRSTVAVTANGLEYKFRGSDGPGKEFSGTRKLVLAPGGKTMVAEFEANRYGELVAWTEVWERY